MIHERFEPKWLTFILAFAFFMTITQTRPSLYKEIKERNLKHPTNIFVSPHVITTGNLRHEIGLAQEYLRQNVCFGYFSLFFYEDTSQENENIHLYYTRIDALVDLLPKINWSMFEHELLSLMQTLKEHRIRQTNLIVLLNHFFTSCHKIVKNGIPCTLPTIRSEEVISLCDSYEQLYENLVQIFTEYMKASYSTSEPVDKSALLISIDTYIQQNYRAPVTTRELAEHFGFTPAYFSTLFRNYKRMTPSEYITRLRIEKAKKLLCESSSLTIKDISAYLGYEDSLYFSKVCI